MIELLDYDPRWAVQFQELQDRIWPRLAGAAIAMEHVGSTSVPGLAAKAVIDVDIVIESAAAFALVKERLEELGYRHRGDQGIAGREVFALRPAVFRHHLYVCAQGSLPLRNHLALRDHLRRNVTAREAYSRLKRELAARFPEDMESYVEGKTEFILAILAAEGIGGDEQAIVRAANSPASADDAA